MEEPLHTAMFSNLTTSRRWVLQAHNQAAEQYEAANGILKAIFKIPHHSESWALQAAIHGSKKPRRPRRRDSGLKFWKTNRWWTMRLAKNFRPSICSRRSFSSATGPCFDKEYVAAKTQLAQDLLRLGQDEEGQLAEEAHEADGYDVTTYNR